MSALPVSPAQYSQQDQVSLRTELERRDSEGHKRGRHIEVGKNCAVILTDTATGDRYRLDVTSGALALTAL